MPWDKDTDKAFPARHPREPGGLRQDILDEIADHLACAAEGEREGAHCGNEDAVWRRALERFGDPNAVARRLWWDAMRETVMREWIQTGVVAVLALAGVAGVVFMGLMLRQFGATNEAVLQALSQQNAGEARWATLEVAFRRGSADGPPAEGVEVRCYGKMFGEDSTSVERVVDESGMLRIGPMRPGEYELECRDNQSGLFLVKDVALFAGQLPDPVRIVTPDVVPEEVHIEFDPPVSRDAEKQLLAVRLTSAWPHGGDVWEGAQECFFGPESGKSFQEGFLSPRSHSALSPRRTAVDSDYVPRANYPVRIAGEPADRHRAALFRRSGDWWKADDWTSLRLAPVSDTSTKTFRAVLSSELQAERRDWALYDQMRAEGLSVTKDLAGAIRREFPEQTVAAAVPVPASSWIIVVDGQYFASQGKERDYEDLHTGNDRSFAFESDDGDRVVLEQAANSVFQLPDASLNLDGKRLVLACYASDADLREFDNPLEAWAVQNDLFAANWPHPDKLPELVAAGKPNLDLGDAPLDHLENTAVQEDAWHFLDVTAGVVDAGTPPHAVLFKWKHGGEEYHNQLAIISAEAKEIEHEHLHPLWLVLEPKAAGEGAGGAEGA